MQADKSLYPCEETDYGSPEIDLALADIQIKKLSDKLKDCKKENKILKARLEKLTDRVGESFAD